MKIINKKLTTTSIMKDASVTSNECVRGNGQTRAAEAATAKLKLRSWLNRYLRIKMTDGRVLSGAFLCTDRDANVILGSCSEYLTDQHTESRMLGLVMVPGRHIVSIHMDMWCDEEPPTRKDLTSSESE